LTPDLAGSSFSTDVHSEHLFVLEL